MADITSPEESQPSSQDTVDTTPNSHANVAFQKTTGIDLPATNPFHSHLQKRLEESEGQFQTMAEEADAKAFGSRDLTPEYNDALAIAEMELGEMTRAYTEAVKSEEAERSLRQHAEKARQELEEHNITLEEYMRRVTLSMSLYNGRVALLEDHNRRLREKNTSILS